MLPMPMLAGAAVPAPRGKLSVYQPAVKTSDIYFGHPAAEPYLKYNHDVDIVRFRNRYIAAWNANTEGAEHVPGQFNYLSTSEDFERWTKPVRLFTAEGGSINPVQADNQWQPAFINYHDRILYSAWCTFTGERTFVSSSTDGVKWTNVEVPTAPRALEGKVVGFPTTHGLLTSKGVMVFPCSLPYKGKFVVGDTRYAAMLLSTDGGKTWEWSDPIEAVSWPEAGEDPSQFGGELITLWEPSVYELPDGTLGLLIRNSTAQDAPERAEKPHRMILTATSSDGRKWTKARPIEVDSICSRMLALSGARRPDDFLMVMNDWHVRVPQRISNDRYFLSLFCAPVCDPDLLLPGPVVQPAGGRAFYPNGFAHQGRLYLAYTYPGGIHASIVDPLPDFTRPFLLPRGGRSGLVIEGRMARMEQRFSSLGLVLTSALTRQDQLRLSFAMNVNRYSGAAFPLLTLGGKTRSGSVVRVVYDAGERKDVVQVRMPGNRWERAGELRMKAWTRFDLRIGASGIALAVDGSAPKEFAAPLMRKISFGGLYETPEWPMGMSQASDVRLDLDSIAIG
jgi:hypothetical protein